MHEGRITVHWHELYRGNHRFWLSQIYIIATIHMTWPWEGWLSAGDGWSKHLKETAGDRLPGTDYRRKLHEVTLWWNAPQLFHLTGHRRQDSFFGRHVALLSVKICEAFILHSTSNPFHEAGFSVELDASHWFSTWIKLRITANEGAAVQYQIAQQTWLIAKQWKNGG